MCVCVSRVQFGGLGQLCDGVLGGDDFTETKELRVWPGYDYLGWSREALGRGSVDVEFHFEDARIFHTMQVPQAPEGEGSGVRVRLSLSLSVLLSLLSRLKLPQDFPCPSKII